jgi:class 3 adenylate cyclase/predicted ATPase
MDFDLLFGQVRELLQRQGRVAYRALKLRFNLDDEALAALKDELIYAQQVAQDEDDRVLVWTGDAGTTPQPAQHPSVPLPPGTIRAEPHPPEAERRHLTVLFCDLVDSTALASQLDPEEWGDVVRAYQEMCAKVIARFEGHIAQYLGDGLLVYFGYPLAHEDDAPRAVRTGLGIIDALRQLNIRLGQERGVNLAVRMGVHTGLVVVGHVGGGARHEQLALGETPNLAARLQGLAAPNTLVISAAAVPLLGGFFAYQSLGTPALKGVAHQLEVYQVLYERMARSRLEAAGHTGLTPLVGRDQEIALLLERWAQVKNGIGQVVLLSGEAGIGKSRIAQLLTEHVASEPLAWLTLCQCSPYHQNTALYPLIELLERVVLRFEREESSQQKLRKLEGFVVQYGLPLAEAVPLLAALLSVPLNADYAPLTVSPEQQKQKTLQTLLTILLRRAAQQPVVFVMEDLHWVDPSTLEFLNLVVDQGPTARILTLLTFRADFISPWTERSHLTEVTLPRLPPRQAAEMTGRVAHGKALPSEVVEQVVAKTDGVPLFVEELTKMVLESGLVQEREGRFELTGPLPPLAIPATLHDSLLARLDRLATVKAQAQLGATLGREFSYELLRAVAPWDEGTLQRGLHLLVEAEFLYQLGLPPQATYRFKHALIQDAAYQSLLRSTRQQYHQRIAQVVEARFPEICETQPELVAHHYTEAGLNAYAVPYWQRAGQRAIERSAHVEAIAHLTKGLDLLMRLPDTPERVQQELACQLSLGASLLATKGHPAPELEHVYARARRLCLQMGETPQLLGALQGLFAFYLAKAEFQSTRELGEEILAREPGTNPDHFRLVAYRALGATHFYLGEFVAAREQLERGIALYDRDRHGSLAFQYGQDVGIYYRVYSAWTLWLLGRVDQALTHVEEGLALARGLSHPFSLAITLGHAAVLHHFRREWKLAKERAEETIALCTGQGFSFYLAMGNIIRGCATVAQARDKAGLSQAYDGLSAWRRTGAVILVPTFLSLLAEAQGLVGQTEAALAALTEALALADTTGECWWSAELHRLRGELLVKFAGADMDHAESSFRHALEIARRQQARSLELRAAMSLGRLWYRQGKCRDARGILTDVHARISEGFDSADREEASSLLTEWK